jgi:hypothetical protein
MSALDAIYAVIVAIGARSDAPLSEAAEAWRVEKGIPPAHGNSTNPYSGLVRWYLAQGASSVQAAGIWVESEPDAKTRESADKAASRGGMIIGWAVDRGRSPSAAKAEANLTINQIEKVYADERRQRKGKASARAPRAMPKRGSQRGPITAALRHAMTELRETTVRVRDLPLNRWIVMVGRRVGNEVQINHAISNMTVARIAQIVQSNR